MPNLGAKVKNTLFEWLRDVLEQLGSTISFVLSSAAEAFMYVLTEPVKVVAGGIMDEVFGTDSPPHHLKRLRENLDKASGLAPILYGILIIAGVIPAVMQAAAAPAANALQRTALDEWRSVLAPADAQLTAFMRGELDLSELYDRLHQMGFDEQQIITLLNIVQIRPTAFEYSQYWLRGEISDVEYSSELQHLGYRYEDRELYKALAFYIPAPPDLIHMAVREVFTPEIAEQFGQFEGFPEQFAEWGAKQGLTREWCMNYWAAHWELPSAQMGFEMLHRGVITFEELQMLLRAADVMPWWRDKVTAISYNPYTRVDIRRMYGVGVLTEEEVNKAYHDIGYDDEHAAKLTAFTVRGVKQESKDLAKGEILAGYRDKIFTTDETSFALANLGYSEDEIDVLIAIEDSKFAADEQKERINLLQTKLDAKQIDITQFTAELGGLNLPATQQELLIAKAELKATVKATIPSKEDAIRWFKAGTLGADDASDILDSLGYDQQYVDLYLSEVSKPPSVAMALRWFVKGLIDEQTVDKYLSTLGYAKTEKALLISEASIKAPAMFKLPSMETIKKWYSTGRIPETDARMYLMQIGYGDKEIDLFITEWTSTEIV